MEYTARLVAWREGLSRVSFDETNVPCTTPGCPNRVNRVLTVPGEHVGRPGPTIQVVRCLDCAFDDAVYVHFDERDVPTKIVTGHGTHMSDTHRDRSAAASLEWSPGAPDPEYDASPTFLGGEPWWLQGEREPPICPECGRAMAFVLQLSSASLDGNRGVDGEPVWPNRWPGELGTSFHLSIEGYATLYLFDCEDCRVNASVTEST